MILNIYCILLPVSSSLMKLNVSCVLCIDRIWGCNNLRRYLARLQLKLFINETVGRRGGTANGF